MNLHESRQRGGYQSSQQDQRRNGNRGQDRFEDFERGTGFGGGVGSESREQREQSGFQGMGQQGPIDYTEQYGSGQQRDWGHASQGYGNWGGQYSQGGMRGGPSYGEREPGGYGGQYGGAPQHQQQYGQGYGSQYGQSSGNPSYGAPFGQGYASQQYGQGSSGQYGGQQQYGSGWGSQQHGGGQYSSQHFSNPQYGSTQSQYGPGQYGPQGQSGYGSSYGYGGPGSYGGGQYGGGGSYGGPGQYSGGMYGGNIGSQSHTGYGSQQYGMGSQQYGGGQYAGGQYGGGQSSGGQFGQQGYGTSQWSGGRGQGGSQFGGSSFGSSQYGGGTGTMSGRNRRNRPMPKNYTRSDQRICEDVCDQIMNSDIDCSDVEVDVKDGKVVLTGTVHERWMRHEIEDTADNVPGVKDVENQIRVKRDDGLGEQSGGFGQSSSSRSTGQSETKYAGAGSSRSSSKNT